MPNKRLYIVPIKKDYRIMGIEKLGLHSPDLAKANFEKLAALFPGCVTETAGGKAIDFDLLKQELGNAAAEGHKERYRLEWPGKREAIVTANLPTNNTLRPVRGESVNFDGTENLYLEGDNLEVLKLLQESYLGKVKMIYIDPPYNTGNDFVYNDNFTGNKEEELFESGQKDELNRRLVANPESSGRYHSDWLSMMYPRLKLARNLLKEDGVIFISIDDHEVHNLRKICDEIFGEGNFRNAFIARRYDKNLNRQFMDAGLNSFNLGFEYIICYSKTPIFSFNPIFKESSEERQSTGYWKGFWNDADRPTMRYDILGFKPESGQWKWKKETSIEAVENYIVYERDFKKKLTLEEYWEHTGKKLKFIRRNSDGKGKNKGVENWIQPSDGILRNTNWLDILVSKSDLASQGLFDYPKNTSLISIIINAACNPTDLVLDFFSGSATTAHALMQLNAEDGGGRKHIMVQLPEATDEKGEAYKAGYKNICEIGKERIRRAGKAILEANRSEINKKQALLETEEDKLAQMQTSLLGADDPKLQEQLKTTAEQREALADLILRTEKLDTGFRVYRLDSSNMQDVYHRPQDYAQADLDLFADNVKPGRTDDDLLAQVMLAWGLPLSLPIKTLEISGKKVFSVADNSLYACFDVGIEADFAKELAKQAPLRAVFRDSGFADDTAKVNVKQLLRQLSPVTEMKVV